ncbi:MAG: hypothetical protein M1831_002390 [Alyxoria varia]|nr:MAG: hypothetical protein M1831_002390 [Alyxoria varia]
MSSASYPRAQNGAAQPQDHPDPSTTAFFYGTLMAPPILRFVLARPFPSDSVKLRPAILPRHRRYRVKEGDYPALLPGPGDAKNTSERAVDETGEDFVTQQNRTYEVRGTYVTGLTASDFVRLDQFEGDEYERRIVKARPLTPSEGPSEQPLYNKNENKGISRSDFYTKSTLSGATTDGHLEPVNATDSESLPIGTGAQRDEEVETQTYIWRAGRSALEMDGEWDFDEFVREKAWAWTNEDYLDTHFEETSAVDATQKDRSGGRRAR